MTKIWSQRSLGTAGAAGSGKVPAAKNAKQISIKIFLNSLLLLSSMVAFGQSTLEISGKVYDAETNNPVSFAQVALYEEGEPGKTTAGGITDENGNFTLTASAGNYDLAIVFVGYEKKVVSSINIRERKDLGVIKLAPSTQQLEEVIVEAEEIQRPVTTDLEGMNVQPSQTLSNAGGSLLDVLRNVPSINVDQEGNISIRGSGSTNILIDGRNSVLASDLEQIPASAIKNIKIINNPNARYDAEGTGGVLNIQLKKGEETGTNGQVEFTLGTRYRMNSALRVNHMGEKFNIYGGYSLRKWPRTGSSTTERETYDNNERLEQSEFSKRNDLEHTINFGGDLFLGNNRHRISYEGAANFEDEKDTENRYADLMHLDTRKLILNYNRINTETEDNFSLDNALIYERLFDDTEKEFRASVSHSFRDQLENQFIDVYSGETLAASGEERSVNDEYRENLIAQADFVHPLWNGKFEAGYKSTFRSFDNDYTYEIRNRNSGNWENQETASNRFLYKDQIHAGYLIHSRSIGKFDVSLGVRAEQTMVDTKLFNTNEKNRQSYLNFFPSFQTLYKVSDNNSFKFTYSRRIDRPNGWRLNPFPDISDSLNIRLGNPQLQPEYIHSLEFGNLFFVKNFDLTTNLFYRHVKGLVDYLVKVEEGISYRMPENLKSSDSYGLEVIGITQIMPWWDLNASYSLFQVKVDGTNVDNSYTNDGLSWNAKLTTDFKFPYEVNMQLTGNYTSPEIEAQGRDFARYYLDASLQRSVLNDKGNISLTLRDIFNTRRFAGENHSEDFMQEFEYKGETRIFLMSLSYKI